MSETAATAERQSLEGDATLNHLVAVFNAIMSGISVGIGPLWLSADVAEFGLMCFFWIRLRRMFPWFFAYLIVDLACAATLYGILSYDYHLYGDVWIFRGWAVAIGECSIAIEAFRRMRRAEMYAAEDVLVATGSSIIAALTIAIMMRFTTFWEDTRFETGSWFHGIMQLFLGFTLWFLWCVPGYRTRRWQTEGRQMFMVAIYLVIAGVKSFSMDYFWSIGLPPPNSWILGAALVVFVLWMLVMIFPRPVPRPISF